MRHSFTLNASVLLSPVAPGASITFTLSFTPDTEGLKEATITIANDDFNKNPYVFAVQGTGVQPEINVMQGSTDIVSDSDSFDFGNVRVSETSSEIVFTIENLGSDTLNLSGSPKIEVTGTDAAIFTVTESMTLSSIPAISATTFSVSFSPTSVGKKTALISIANDDSDENPYTFTVTGKTTTFDFNGDGYDDVIVGAYHDDDGGSNSGCAYIFAGYSLLPQNIRATIARVKLRGSNSYDYLGYSVSGGN